MAKKKDKPEKKKKATPSQSPPSGEKDVAKVLPGGEDSGGASVLDNVTHVDGMYQNWFLEYASYVILERAVPYVEDGLKPVQRRILHVLWELEDGRYNKVANIIGQTMKYHPQTHA